MDRNLALEMVRATEASALASARWMGKGDALAADRAAVSAMKTTLNSIPFSGKVVTGAGEAGSAQELSDGDVIGSGGEDDHDLVIDALECTRSVAFGRTNAMSVVAMAPRGSFFCPPSRYLEKLAVGPEAVGLIGLDRPVRENLERLAEAKGYRVSDLTVVILDRERHVELIQLVRDTGARIHLIPDGDVAAAIAAATPGTGVDVLMGTGSSGAGVLAAAALRCIGGEIQTRLAPTDRHETDQLRNRDHVDLKRIYHTVDLVRGDNVMFAATGVTDGDVLNGVLYRNNGATTHSMVLRSKTGTRRLIVTDHFFERNPIY